ncbi:MAG: hypothetical protein B6I22_00705 [Desulfobacteraceae bacterium 4572_123]|nr:MAG: hypothetical protein B6I22_00705 [Desulfobacteraceae bacterium 4572_123]
MVYTGLDNLIKSPPDWLEGRRLGLLCNPASVDRHFKHARDLINERFPGQLTTLFSPQHGFWAAKQDNMIESDHTMDPVLDIPVFSLYGETRVPTEKMFNDIDILLIDLQDAGTRVYTFIYTMSYCMEAARRCNRKIVILDRPNPIGGLVTEGNLLSHQYSSFVGRFPIPMRHGMTIGEIALLFNDHYRIGCDLEVIPMQGWHRAMYFQDTGLCWVPPSPNLPTPVSAMVYPGQVLLEGTNISEGRGTSQPFELFGAPYLDVPTLSAALPMDAFKGVILRPAVFEPVANKWQGRHCRGFQIHIIDRSLYQPYLTTLKLLQAVIANHGADFKWKSPPYEYEFEKQPFDLITGSREIRQCLENGENLDHAASAWQADLYKFNKVKQLYHLYT